MTHKPDHTNPSTGATRAGARDASPAAEQASPGLQLARDAMPDDVVAFMDQQAKTVVTFVGYSGAGYEDEAGMLGIAARVLDQWSPETVIVNIGATAEGIGAVYELAKRRGFTTSGIVSTQAKRWNVSMSPCVDYVFYVDDDHWGGYVDGGERLSPTSATMVEVSDVIIAIGGGDIARDELCEAKKAGKTWHFFAAEMDHETAIAAATRKGLPEPTDFSGTAGQAV
ncbi:MAG: hypothetical protein KDJ27_20055 [Gammaproteobacteria bacterium]|nr:hypothetical protein [Gammaproteobacteria bacterium]